MLHTIKVGIVDDEKSGLSLICSLLKNNFPEVTICFKATSVEELDTFLKKEIVDLLYLDIRLQNNLVFNSEYLENYNAIKIYTTAYDSYALKAIKTNAFNYILKPIDSNEFFKVTYKAIREIGTKQSEKNFNVKKLIHIDIPTKMGYKRVLIENIVRCESYNNYTIIYLNTKEQLIVSLALVSFETKLNAMYFCRIHQKHLINLNYFKEYLKGKGGTVILTDNTTLSVAVRKKSVLLNKLSILKR